jgi:hypothetical protein
MTSVSEAARIFSRRLAMVLVSLLLAGCLGKPNPSASADAQTGAPTAGTSVAASASATSSPEQSAAAAGIWKGGIGLVFGQRYAAASAESAWIVTRPYSGTDLILNRLSLADGVLSTVPVKGIFADVFASADAADDGAGQLWMVYLQQILRIDEAHGTTHRWVLPPAPYDVVPSLQFPAAGQAVADAWDATNHQLLLARTGDYRLYRFDPGTSTVGSSELPIETTEASTIAVMADGSIGVSGQRRESLTPAPAAVVVPHGEKPTKILGVVAVCAAPSGIAALDETGAVRLPATATKPLAAISVKPDPGAPLACDRQGNIFSAFVANGTLTVVRIAQAKAPASVVLPLAPTPAGPPTASAGQQASDGSGSSTTPQGGTSPGASGPTPSGAPVETADPLLLALLPDGLGGVWLVSADGTRTDGTAPSYPSLWHTKFQP